MLAVRGDSFELDLASLPDIRVEDLNGYKIGIAHNIGDLGQWVTFARKPKDLFGEPVDCVVFGHTHHPFFDVIHGVRFVNPGSAGPRGFRLPVSAGLLTIEGAEVAARVDLLMA